MFGSKSASRRSARSSSDISATLEELRSASQSASDNLADIQSNLAALKVQMAMQGALNRVALRDIVRLATMVSACAASAAVLIFYGVQAYAVPSTDTFAYGSVGFGVESGAASPNCLASGQQSVKAAFEYTPIDNSFRFSFFLPPQCQNSKFVLLLDGAARAIDASTGDGVLSLSSPPPCDELRGQKVSCQMATGTVPKAPTFTVVAASCDVPGGVPPSSIPIVVSGHAAMKDNVNWAHAEVITASILSDGMMYDGKPGSWSGPPFGKSTEFPPIDYCFRVNTPYDSKAVDTSPPGAITKEGGSLDWKNQPLNAHVMLEERSAQSTANILLASGGATASLGIGLIPLLGTKGQQWWRQHTLDSK